MFKSLHAPWLISWASVIDRSVCDSFIVYESVSYSQCKQIGSQHCRNAEDAGNDNNMLELEGLPEKFVAGLTLLALD